jgi:4-carboxymuconolactone decarboxylase
MMCILASCIAAQGQAEFRTMLAGALNAGVTPVEAKEVLYQAVPYVGMAKVLDFVHIANDVLVTRGVALPLEGQSTTSPGTRFERGLAVQKAIFGAGHIDALREAAPEGQKHIQDYLSMNCFGDFVTRGGLDTGTRELLTFSMLLTLGGCEPQLKGHIRGNLNVGNDKRTLLTVITQLLPYVGYPRSLNAIACLNEVAPGNE